jgi:hypothetical protein
VQLLLAVGVSSIAQQSAAGRGSPVDCGLLARPTI